MSSHRKWLIDSLPRQLIAVQCVLPQTADGRDRSDGEYCR